MNLNYKTLTYTGDANQPSDFAGNNGNIIWALDGAPPPMGKRIINLESRLYRFVVFCSPLLRNSAAYDIL